MNIAFDSWAFGENIEEAKWDLLESLLFYSFQEWH